MIKHGDGMALVTDDDLRGLELQVRLTDKSTMWDCLDIREGLLNRIELQHGLLVERRDQGEEIDRLREGERAADAEIERLQSDNERLVTEKLHDDNALLRAESEASRIYDGAREDFVRKMEEMFEDASMNPYANAELHCRVTECSNLFEALSNAREAVDAAGLLKEGK